LRGALRSEYGLTTTLFDFHPAEALAIAAVLALGALAALYPAWRAYRSDVAANLRKG
jgi:ABC-type lipoprotein release transport system permease subunit